MDGIAYGTDIVLCNAMQCYAMRCGRARQCQLRCWLLNAVRYAVAFVGKARRRAEQPATLEDDAIFVAIHEGATDTFTVHGIQQAQEKRQPEGVIQGTEDCPWKRAGDHMWRTCT